MRLNQAGGTWGSPESGNCCSFARIDDCHIKLHKFHLKRAGAVPLLGYSCQGKQHLAEGM